MNNTDYETCSVCGWQIPKPVELHHTEQECKENIEIEQKD